MAISRRASRSLALLVAVMLVLPLTAANLTRAEQDSPGLFQSWKGIAMMFVDYGEKHGGLAQQGYPIGDLVVERSSTDEKLYVVQYFERAVMEYHPEQRNPYDVLLQLLGSFLYARKYPQGAPGQQPNTSAGSVLFKETGKRLGGIFQQYWNNHGGLAQQGYPISDEFNEKSDLDGKTYRVQYFERAVFEYHPEQKDPKYQVLLSQLGTFRYKGRYGGLTKQVTGGGAEQPSKFPLKAGLAVFQSLRALDGYYNVNLVDSAGRNITTVASASGPADYSAAVNIPADGMYGLDVGADGVWTVNVTQPKGSYSPPPAQQKWSGNGWQATPLFSLNAGQAKFHATGKGTDIVRAALLDQDGKLVELIGEGNGALDVTKTVSIPADGVYIVQAVFDGDWAIEVQQ